MDFEPWLKHLAVIQKEIEELLVSQAMLESSLRSLLTSETSPVSGVVFEISPMSPFKVITIGLTGDGPVSDVRSVPELDSFGTAGKVTVWMSSRHGITLKPTDTSRMLEGLSDVLRAYWKGDLRDTTSCLISRQNSERRQLLESTIRDWSTSNIGFALLYCDLDNFKAANDTLGHSKGDNIIRDFAAVLSDTARRESIIVHRSGDEFIVLDPSPIHHSALALARRIHENVRAHDFGTGQIRIDSKIGIAVVLPNTELGTYASIEATAETATTWNSVKQRGKARLAAPIASNVPLLSEESLNIALAIVKSNLLTQEPFANPWLNFISTAFSNCGDGRTLLPAPLSEIPQILEWIAPAFDDTILTASITADGTAAMPPILSHLDVAFAAAHGFYRRALSEFQSNRQGSLEIVFDNDVSAGCLRIVQTGEIVFSWGDGTAYSKSYNLGAFWQTDDVVVLSEESCRRAVLIKIGHFRELLPAKAFSEVITIDDRPTKGGGLPDFWEATIARLVSHVESNPNVCALFVSGDEHSATSSVTRLRSINQWASEAEKLSFRTGMSMQSIIAVAGRIGEMVFTAMPHADLAARLADTYRLHHKLLPVSVPLVDMKRRFLSRNLNIEPFGLQRDDGISVKTIAEAFPLVLEIARKAAAGDRIVDQAGQELYELVDFKVHLSTPTSDMIPSFYTGEEGSLNDYFQKQFVDPVGLFASAFSSTDQLAAVTNHVASSLKRTPPFHTRRGILVVPHTINSGADLTPLGLVSIRLIPLRANIVETLLVP